MSKKHLERLFSLIFLKSYHNSFHKVNVCPHRHLETKTGSESHVFPYGLEESLIIYSYDTLGGQS